MKYTFIFFIVSLVIFTSCDGKDRAYKTNQEIIEDSNLSPSFFEQISYIPEQYSERIIDSVFNNGFRVKIKNYSDMNNSVLFKEKIDSIIYKQYFREFITHLIVKQNETTLFDEIINKDFIINKSGVNFKFLNESVLFSTWVKDSFINDSEVNVVLGYRNPTTEKCKYYYISINKKGNYIIKEQNEFD